MGGCAEVSGEEILLSHLRKVQAQPICTSKASAHCGCRPSSCTLTSTPPSNPASAMRFRPAAATAESISNPMPRQPWLSPHAQSVRRACAHAPKSTPTPSPRTRARTHTHKRTVGQQQRATWHPHIPGQQPHAEAVVPALAARSREHEGPPYYPAQSNPVSPFASSKSRGRAS